MDGFDLFSSSTVKVDHLGDARRRMRHFQMRHGRRITPELSVKISNIWDRHIKNCPDGSTLGGFIDGLEEAFSK